MYKSKHTQGGSSEHISISMHTMYFICNMCICSSYSFFLFIDAFYRIPLSKEKGTSKILKCKAKKAKSIPASIAAQLFFTLIRDMSWRIMEINTRLSKGLVHMNKPYVGKQRLSVLHTCRTGVIEGHSYQNLALIKPL